MQLKFFNRNRDGSRHAGGRHHPATIIISVILTIVVISYTLFFYLQFDIEKTTKDSLVAQQTKFQVDSTKKFLAI